MPMKLLSLSNMNPLLAAAELGGYAVGAFSPRYTAMIRPVLAAAQAANSPLIVQISQKEFDRHQITPGQFAEEFCAQVRALPVSVPVALHLDHSWEIATIAAAIAAGFTSVMIDASRYPLEENMAITRKVVEMAHARGVSVEAELGRIGTTDFVETSTDDELFTDPEEARVFVGETGVDALAVSVGTAHGVYNVRQPRIDYDRLRAIRAAVDVHLVLHGGSGVPASMVQAAIRIGISKVNIATELELAALGSLNQQGHLTDAAMLAFSEEQLAGAQNAVKMVAQSKMQYFLGSYGRASNPGSEDENHGS